MPNLAEQLVAVTQILRLAGIAEPGTEARILCAGMLGIDRAQLLTGSARILSMEECAALDAAVARRSRGEPVARILGRSEFWSLPIQVNEATLAPRADSETLIDAALVLFPDRRAPLRILDLGTGSGCLLLALLSEFPLAAGIGVDIAPEAARMAAHNAAQLGFENRVAFRVADWNEARFAQSICTKMTEQSQSKNGDIPLPLGKKLENFHGEEKIHSTVERCYSPPLEGGVRGGVRGGVGNGGNRLVSSIVDSSPTKAKVLAEAKTKLSYPLPQGERNSLLPPNYCENISGEDAAQEGTIGLEGKFDLIIANPPYIAYDTIAALDREVRDYDPHAALDGGADGLDAYRVLAKILPDLWRAGGRAVFEIGFDQALSVEEVFRNAGFDRIQLKRDLAGQPRCVVIENSIVD